MCSKPFGMLLKMAGAMPRGNAALALLMMSSSLWSVSLKTLTSTLLLVSH